MLRGGSRRCVLVRGLVGGVLYFCDGRADACLFFFFQAEDGIRDRSRQFLLNRSSDLLVRLVVLLPFQLLRLSLATPSRWTPLALSVFLHCVVALLLTLL